MSITSKEATTEFLKRFGIEVRVYQEFMKAYVCWGPGLSAGIDPTTMSVVIEKDEDWSRYWTQVLHEASHIVWWHPTATVNVDENALTVFEHRALMDLGLPGHEYLSDNYTAETGVDAAGTRIWQYRRPTRSRWYQDGFIRCVAAGVLYLDGSPTWRRVDWDRLSQAKPPRPHRRAGN